MVNIADVYDDEALKRIHPTLSFLKEVDKRSGYRTKQMMVVPILDGDDLLGVLQVINNKGGQPFGELAVEGVTQLCRRWPPPSGSARSRSSSRPSTTAWSPTRCCRPANSSSPRARRARRRSRRARADGEFQVKSRRIGPSLSKFFGVPYEPFKTPASSRSELLKALKRDFVEEQAVDAAGRRRRPGDHVHGPGACAARASPQVFPARSSPTGSPRRPNSRKRWRSFTARTSGGDIDERWPT